MSNKSDKPEASAISGVVGSLTEKAREAVEKELEDKVGLAGRGANLVLSRVVPGWGFSNQISGAAYNGMNVCTYSNEQGNNVLTSLVNEVNRVVRGGLLSCVALTSIRCGYNGEDFEAALSSSVLDSTCNVVVQLVGIAAGATFAAMSASNPGEYIKRV
jgi:hypothetical protein